MLKNLEVVYDQQENSGNYVLKKEKGFNKSGSFVVRREITDSGEGSAKALEKSISFSRSGVLKNGLKLLRPEKSQYIVWFDKQKYSVISEVLPKEKSIVFKMQSPERDWNGERKFKFPKSNGVFCYYFQLIECLAMTGYFNQLQKKRNLSAEINIIWEGYPYIREQYSGIPDEVFTSAVFEYDGKTEVGDYKFSLRFNNQIILYQIRKNFKYERVFWISEGMTTTVRSVK